VRHPAPNIRFLIARWSLVNSVSEERHATEPRTDAPATRGCVGAWLGTNEGSRSSFVAFCLLAIAALPLYLSLGRRWWFYLDEWGFLTSRSAGSAGDLLRPYNQHWTTLPILMWRALWRVVGAHSYLPYQMLSVLSHVTVAALCRAVMRRGGVQPWVATIAAGSFLLFGTGAQNILSAFQITFTGALAFGFAQLLLADHEGRLDNRDWLGLVAGVLGLMCSGVAVAMIAVVGVAALLRRGPRVAAFHTVPLVAIYLAWYERYGRSGTKITGSIGTTISFARTGIDATFAALGQTTGAGAMLGVSLIAGLALLWVASDVPTRRARLAIPTALLVGTLVFFATAAVGHKDGPAVVVLPKESRDLYVAAALMLPVIAIAVAQIVRRSRVLGTLATMLLLVGIPGNLSEASNFARSQAQLVAGSRSVILSIAQMPLSAQAPGSLRPDPVGAPSVTLQWLRAEVRTGRIPTLRNPTAAVLAANRLRLSLMELDTLSGQPCAPLATPVVRHLTRGERISIGDGAVTVTALSSTAPQGVVTFGNVLFRSSRLDHTLVSVLGQLTIRIAPLRGHRAQLC
jgi:hypothetical protein